MTNKITHFRIDYTDVILQDYGDGKGKIIISNDDRDYNLSYYWGSMGEGYDLSKFILKTNDGYLINKLGQRHDDGPIDIKKTMAAVRKYIKEDTEWRFYYSPEDDKYLRNALNDIQRYTHDSRDFVDRMTNLDNTMSYSGINDVYNRGKAPFDGMIYALSTEPWHFIINEEPQVNAWLGKFLPKVREFLKKEKEE